MASKTSQSGPHHESGKVHKLQEKEITILPNDLSIIWGKDERYWNVPDDGTPAELHQVCWLEITGCVEDTYTARSYEVSFNLSLMPEAFGWGSAPIYLMTKRGEAGKPVWKTIALDQVQSSNPKNYVVSSKSNDGDTTKEATDKSKFHFGLYEVWGGTWKGGLKISGVTVSEVSDCL